MNKLSLALAVLALLGAACGDSGGKTKADAGGDAGEMDSSIVIPPTDSGPPDPYPECDRVKAADSIGPAGEKWGDKPKPWTEDDVNACNVLCPDGALQCINDECNKGEDFVTCYLQENALCVADEEGATCFEEWGTFGCCYNENKCGASMAAQDACTTEDGACFDTLRAFFMCSGNDQACGRSAAAACISPNPPAPEAGVDGGTPASDAGASEAGVSEAGADGSVSTLSAPISSLWLSRLAGQRTALRTLRAH